MSNIHPTAEVDKGAEIGNGVEIGPFCVIGPNVKIGDKVALEILRNCAINSETHRPPFMGF